MLPTIVAAFVLLPIVVAMAFAARVRSSLRRPGLFVIGGILEGYLVVAAVLYWVLQPFTHIGVSGTPASNASLAGPLDTYGRFLIGLLTAAAMHLIGLWGTYRGAAKV